MAADLKLSFKHTYVARRGKDNKDLILPDVSIEYSVSLKANKFHKRKMEWLRDNMEKNLTDKFELAWLNKVFELRPIQKKIDALYADLDAIKKKVKAHKKLAKKGKMKAVQADVIAINKERGSLSAKRAVIDAQVAKYNSDLKKWADNMQKKTLKDWAAIEEKAADKYAENCFNRVEKMGLDSRVPWTANFWCFVKAFAAVAAVVAAAVATVATLGLATPLLIGAIAGAVGLAAKTYSEYTKTQADLAKNWQSEEAAFKRLFNYVEDLHKSLKDMENGKEYKNKLNEWDHWRKKTIVAVEDGRSNVKTLEQDVRALNKTLMAKEASDADGCLELKARIATAESSLASANANYTKLKASIQAREDISKEHWALIDHLKTVTQDLGLPALVEAKKGPAHSQDARLIGNLKAGSGVFGKVMTSLAG